MAKKILFLCTGNSARSQMAEAWAKHFFSDRYEIYSAGTAPKGIHPLTLKVMEEVGIDVTNQRSKHLDELKNIEFDFVITLCDDAKESCPVYPKKTRVIHKSFPDPVLLGKSSGEQLKAFRDVRDRIKAFVRELEKVIEQE